MLSYQRIKILVVTCAALFMSMLDNLVLGVALPSIQKSFHANLSDLEWFTNAYTLAFAVLLIPFSMLGERIGRKKVFLIGVVLFTLGSALSGMSHHSLQLIFSRALQGIGGAAIVPLSLTLVNEAFTEKMRAAAMGIWSGISGLGLSVGPLVGGLILDGAPWQLIFWVNVPVGILAMFLGLRWLPESKGEAKPMNPLSIFLLGAGMFGIIFGLQRSNADGWSSSNVIGSIFGGFIVLFLYYVWERTRKRQLIQFHFFKNGRYSTLIIAGFLMNAGIFGSIFLLTLFLQIAQGYTALEAGVREMAWTGCTMVAAPIAGLLVGRFGTKTILSIGLLFQAIGLLGFVILISRLGTDFSFGYLAPFMVTAGTGMGLSFTPLAHGILSTVPQDASGEASGISNATRELGGVFGIAICTLIFESGKKITSPETFSTHMVPSLLAGAGFIALALGFVMVLFRGTFKKQRLVETEELGKRA
ncbi:MFS transporter [Sporolactobacillus pectinivorans]|uniref:MFS transporter n=1 Tax=Sporolactobacillus pectinivorans TaxID=1591408 RepID=UPI000C25A3C0|nr:MFS transporter [Sporolactobacillus pectinivorans]